MDIKRINKYFVEDYTLSKGDLLDVENILSDFPYFQSLRFLYLKAWYTLDYQKFKSELEKMAIFVSNREALFFFIFKEEFSLFVRNKKSVLNSDKTLQLIDAFFEVTNTPVQANLEIDSSTKNLATTDYLSFIDDIEKKKSTKSQSKDKVNISTGLITLETIDEKEPSLKQLEELEKQDEKGATDTFLSTTVKTPETISFEDGSNIELTDSTSPNELENTVDVNGEIKLQTNETNNQSLILIESFNQLVNDVLGSKTKGSIIEDTQTETHQEEIEVEEVAQTLEDKTKESIDSLIIVDTLTTVSDVNKSGKIKPIIESHAIKEEQIEEEDFNTIGSEEMSILITERLEESLKMLQDLRRSAISESKKKEAIIDKFLSKEHKPIVFNKKEIEQDEDSYTLDDDKSEEELDEGFFTETLAKIYTKQGRYDKAYEIIKHLSLKVSNKNVYFVEQLDYLEKLISKKNKIK